MTCREDQEQIALMSWALYQQGKFPELKLLFHIPNGGGRSKAEAGRFKAMGVKAGVPDLCLPVPRNGFHGMWIELKREDGGRVSADQRHWLDDLREMGYLTMVCHGWLEASNMIMAYLNGAIREEEEHEPT